MPIGRLTGLVGSREDSSRHLAALVGAAAARLGAAFTVLGLVRTALVGTAVARFGTGAAHGGRQRRGAAYVTGADPAQLGAVATSADAVGHLGVADAGIAALLALLGTCDARFDAGTELVVDHERSFPRLDFRSNSIVPRVHDSAVF